MATSKKPIHRSNLRKSKSAGRKAAKKRPPVKALAKKKSAQRTPMVKGSSNRAAKSKPPSRQAKAQPGEPAVVPNALRLTFSYVGDEVKLVSQQAVEMVVPATDAVKDFRRQKGFWAELKSERNKTLYRQVMHNPTRNDAEVFSDDPHQSISREPAPKRKGVFVVVVPNVAMAAEVALSRSPDPRPNRALGLASVRSLATAPATEIARFKLKK